MKFLILVSAISLFSFGCNSSQKKMNEAVNLIKHEFVKPREAYLVALDNATTVQEAVQICKQYQKSFKTPDLDEVNEGRKCLEVYVASHPLTLAQVDIENNETSYGAIMKNPDNEVGKKLCVEGSIVQISENNNIQNGIFGNWGYSKVYSFHTYGSSGKLMQGSHSWLCGISAGTYSYHNGNGGFTHAAEILGVWYIKENRIKK